MEPQEVFNFCKGQIAHYKVPKYVKFVDSFPLTITGKPQKFKMVEAIKVETGFDMKKLETYQIRTY